MRGKKEDRRYLTTTQAARLAHLSPSTLLRAIQSKKLRAFSTPGGHFRVDPDSLKSFITALGPDGTNAKKVLVVTLPSKEQARMIREMRSHEGFSVSEEDSLSDAVKRNDFKPRALLLVSGAGSKKGIVSSVSADDIHRFLN